MAIQRDSDYPGRWGTADADYPGGIPKNRTTPTSADGSYLEEKLWKDQYGFQDAAITQGNITRSGNPETATASDVLDGIKSVVAGQALTWSATRNYNHPVIVSGSDGELYLSVQDNGPGSTVQDPTTDVSDTYWQLLSDVIGGGGVAVWDSGVDYTNPVQVYGSDDQLYISQADSGPSGVGARNPTTDDGTYWRVLNNNFAYSKIVVQDQKAAGTNGGSSVAGVQTRVLNTVVHDDGIGVSLSANQLTFANTGEYLLFARAGVSQSIMHRIYWYNVTGATIDILGSSERNASGAGDVTNSFIAGQPFTASAGDVFELRHWVQQAQATNGLGFATPDGQPAVYSEVIIWRLK